MRSPKNHILDDMKYSKVIVRSRWDRPSLVFEEIVLRNEMR